MPLSPDAALRILGEPLFRVVGDEVFILMPDSKVHWLKNETAKVLWERLLASGAAGVTPRALAAGLAAEFDVTADVALRDVVAFLVALADRRLVGPVATGQDPD